MVDAARKMEVAGVIKALNPVAEIVYADHGVIPLKKILGTGKFDLERASAMPGWAHELEGRHTPETEAYGIDSFVLRSHEPLHPQRFAKFMDGFAQSQGLHMAGQQTALGCQFFSGRKCGNARAHRTVVGVCTH